MAHYDVMMLEQSFWRADCTLGEMFLNGDSGISWGDTGVKKWFLQNVKQRFEKRKNKEKVKTAVKRPEDLLEPNDSRVLYKGKISGIDEKGFIIWGDADPGEIHAANTAAWMATGDSYVEFDVDSDHLY